MQKNTEQCSKFIESLEIVYSLFLAVGLSNLFLKFKLALSYEALSYWTLVFICALTLIRFFFAPSKNIEYLISAIKESSLGEKEKYKGYLLTLLIDTPILFIHAILFTIMCQFAQEATGHIPFFISFFFLLVINSLWLKSICCRVEKVSPSCRDNITFWAKNNNLFAIPIGIIVLAILLLSRIFVKNDWFITIEYSCFCLLFILGSLNCIRDLKNTYKIYLFHD